MPSSIIVAAAVLYETYQASALFAFAVNMVASAIITKAFFNPNQPSSDLSGNSPNPGNRQQAAPATDNKLPVIYGQAWLGGIITDLSITGDNQQLFYVLSLCEVTNNGADTITFGDCYFGGKKVVFQGNGHTVASLLDESTGILDTTVDGKIDIYFYNNGSFSPVNSTLSAVQVMQTSGLVYQWNNSKAMTNCAFAIVRLTYSQNAGIRGIQQTKFQITNSRHKPGDCFLDYLTNITYGAALPLTQINTTSLTALNVYCDETFTYTTYSGGSSTQTRFRFDGVIDTNRTIMQNLQDMASCCDCLIKYNEITAQWGVIVQSPTYSVAMDINDSNMVSAISISPLDLAGSYNVIECKFPDKSNQDAFNSSTFNLSQIDPLLLFPNEPVNKQSVSLPLVNDSVRAQYLANRLLKAGREDLQVQVNITYVGIQLEAGDIVTLTNANYGWIAKLFRINKIIETFGDDGSVTAKLTLTEFNPSIYDDVSITQFKPSPNTGIGSPINFGVVPAPTIDNSLPSAGTPSFNVNVVSSASGITQYAEIWYSAFNNPTSDQRIFAGTTAIQSNGNPYTVSTNLPAVTLINIPAGDWYFFSRMVNSIGTSTFSNASAVFKWRPRTFQYTDRWLVVVYADSITGTGFSLTPTNKTYYGLLNSPSANLSTNPADYIWYLAPTAFGTSNYLLFTNRGSRKFSFDVGNAAYANLTGAFVPTETSIYDPTLWSGQEATNNYIDLDARTGQLTAVGTTAVSAADGLVSVTNNTNGTMVVSLQKFLNFGSGIYTKTANVASLTIDVYGRVVGFTEPDNFYYTQDVFNATAGQTTFSVTHVIGNILVFRNGVLCDTSEYTETTSTIVFTNACSINEKIVILNMRAVSTSDFYEPLNITVASSSGSDVVYNNLPYQTIEAGDKLCFTNTGTPTTYTVQSINTSTKTITFTTTVSGATVGNSIYRFRAASSEYRPFSRYSVDLTNSSEYTPTTFEFNNGFELLFVNGIAFTEIDYDLSGNTVNGFANPITGKMTIILFSQNNLGVPASNITNTVVYSNTGQVNYNFSSNPLALELYANGSLLTNGATYDYTATSSAWSLVTAFDNNATLINQQTYARMGAA